MNQISHFQFQGNQDDLPGHAESEKMNELPLPSSHRRRDQRIGPEFILVLASILYLALGWVPNALAINFNHPGWGWDYSPCDDSSCVPCPPASSAFGDGFLDPDLLRRLRWGNRNYECFLNCGGIQQGNSRNDSGRDYLTGTPGTGMPIWGVSEPAITLWLEDSPMSYQPSRGPAISFRLYYKSNPDQGSGAENGKQGIVFSVGKYWYTPSLSYVIDSGNQINVWNNGHGGTVNFTNSGSIDYRSHTSLILSNNGSTVTRIIKYPSGAQDVYGQCITGYDGTNRYFLTLRYDPAGNCTTHYWGTDANTGAAILTAMVDVDGKTNNFSYTDSNGYTMLEQATDACGHTTTLLYDLTLIGCPTLTNITDAIGMSSGIQYSGYAATALITPYGTNTFSYISPGDPPMAIHVNELGKRDHLYLYVDADATGQITNSYAAFCPSTATNFSNLFDSGDSDKRNSFYWGPRQYTLLPTGFVSLLTTNINPTVDLTKLYTTNYLEARQRHWLIDANNGISTNQGGQTLSLERSVSPDGTSTGKITWYDYDGKAGGIAKNQGTMSLPLFEAWKLPNGESRFIRSERNSLGYPTRVIDTYSGQTGALLLCTNTLTYGTNNIDLLMLTNALGFQVTSNLFNANHQVLTNWNALNEITVFNYDANHRLILRRMPSGLTTSNYFGTDGYLSQTTDIEIGRANSYTWLNGLVYSHTDERGLTVTNTWDGLNRLTKVTYPDRTFITNIYDRLDLVQVIDRMTFANSYDYNGFGQVRHAVDALSHTNTYDYCDCGHLDSITDPLGNFTSFTYDLAGRRIRTTYPDTNTVSENYDLMNRVTNVQDSAGTSVTNWYNNQGIVIAVSNAFGRVRFSQLDALDRTTYQMDANSVGVNLTYDKLNRVQTRSYPDSGVENFGYTANVTGPTSYTNQVGNIALYTYDQAGRMKNEVSVGVSTNQYSFGPAGDLWTLTDGKNQTTTWYYDKHGRVTNKLDTLNNSMFLYGYDANNRLTNRWTPAKGTTTYRYDPVGNLTNIVYPVSPSIALAYDALNRLTTMVDGVGTSTYGYDGVGQMLREDGPWSDDTVSYTYTNRLRTSVSLISPTSSAWTQVYGYDASRRLTSVTSPAGSFGYTNDPVYHMQVSGLTLPNGAYITNQYDSVARLASTVLKNSGQTILNSHSYGLNQANQRTQQVFTAGNYVNYTYDNMGQLLSAIGKESGGVTNRWQEQLGYRYDPAGNLNSRTNNALVQTFVVNNLNELSNVSRSGTFTVEGTTTSPATNVTVNGQAAALYRDATFASAGQALVNGTNTFTAIAKDSYGRSATNISVSYLPSTASYAYDSNGNLTTDGSRCFAYDDENQLTSVWITNVWRSDFTYDGRMRRRVRTECTWNGSAWVTNQVVRYVYDGNVVIQERDGNNLPQVTYTRCRDLSGGLERAGGIGGLLARTDNALLESCNPSAHSYYHADGNGNVTCLINPQQVIVARYLYDAFGNIMSQSGALAEANVYRFSSKEFHAVSGLIYYLYRFYEPNLQRWINRDPSEEMNGANLYTFLVNAPSDYVDTDGQGIWTDPDGGRWPSRPPAPTGPRPRPRPSPAPAQPPSDQPPPLSPTNNVGWINGNMNGNMGGFAPPFGVCWATNFPDERRPHNYIPVLILPPTPPTPATPLNTNLPPIPRPSRP